VNLLSQLEYLVERAKKNYPEGIRVPPKTFHLRLEYTQRKEREPDREKLHQAREEILAIMQKHFPGFTIRIIG
jgi:hypothetical protein